MQKNSKARKKTGEKAQWMEGTISVFWEKGKGELQE
jgi:hypothetical protein